MTAVAGDTYAVEINTRFEPVSVVGGQIPRHGIGARSAHTALLVGPKRAAVEVEHLDEYIYFATRSVVIDDETGGR